MGDLKPCPLCKSTRVHISRMSRDERCGYVGQATIACSDCGIRISAYDTKNENGWAICGDAEDKVSDLWNRRPEPTPDVVERVENWVCEGIPDEAIEAGVNAWDAARHDMENYVSGITTDWDEGMIVAAIFKAMRAAIAAMK